MRPLATLFLVLGAADLVALNLVIGPAALAEKSQGAEGSRGDRPDRAAATTTGAASERSPTSLQRVTQPDVPAPPRPLVASAPVPVAAPDPLPVPVPVPDPDPVPVADPVPVPDPVADQDPDSHPDSMPSPVILHFDLDRDHLGHRSRAALDRIASRLEERADLAVGIDGHADESGSEEHNQTLSERRAQRVAEYLEEHGVDAPRMAVHGFGELQPIDAGRQRDSRNRRVEVRFVSRNATGDTE